MDQIKVLLDSDVIVSALLSEKGASSQILKKTKIKKVISETIKKEVKEVAKRLKINLPKEIFQKTPIVILKIKKGRLVKDFLPYVYDQEDSHVVAAAHKAGVRFLITYNLKHYRQTRIKNDLGIIIMKPGLFLQYLRSQKI